MRNIKRKVYRKSGFCVVNKINGNKLKDYKDFVINAFYYLNCWSSFFYKFCYTLSEQPFTLCREHWHNIYPNTASYCSFAFLHYYVYRKLLPNIIPLPNLYWKHNQFRLFMSHNDRNWLKVIFPYPLGSMLLAFSVNVNAIHWFYKPTHFFFHINSYIVLNMLSHY